MKILIITYYWPPAGGSGVQRWLKFVKYLPDSGIEPVVYTVENPQYALTDPELKKEIPEHIEILKQPIFEPNSILSRFKSNQHQTSAGFLNSNPSFFERSLQYIRANYFIPDARKFWIKPSVKYLSEYLKDNPVDVIITTGPPHSMHLIGMALQKKFPVKWIADFRDPWTDIDYFHQLPLTELSKKKHLNLEKEVLQSADAVLVVGKTMKQNYKRYNQNIHVITNGFDGEIERQSVELDKKFSLTHIGLMNADRNPVILWEVLSEMMTSIPEFAEDLEVKLIGKAASEVHQSIEQNGFQNNVRFIDYRSHDKVISDQRSAQVLLLAVNDVPSAKGIITGKVFEYLQAGRPILAIAPEDGDLAEIIRETRSGAVTSFKDKEKIKSVLTNFYQQYKKGILTVRSEKIEQYHRKNLTKELVKVIKGLS